MGRLVVFVTVFFIGLATANNWRDCGTDYKDCCKVSKPYKPKVKFSQIQESNWKGEKDVVRFDDPFFVIEKAGKSLVDEPIGEITTRIRGYYKLPGGLWLKYVDVKKVLCEDKDIETSTGLCPSITANTEYYAKVHHGKLNRFTPFGTYKSIETWYVNGEVIGCVDTGEWQYAKKADKTLI